MEGYRQEEECRQKNKTEESGAEEEEKATYGQEAWSMDLGLKWRLGQGLGQGLQQELKLEWVEP